MRICPYTLIFPRVVRAENPDDFQYIVSIMNMLASKHTRAALGPIKYKLIPFKEGDTVSRAIFYAGFELSEKEIATLSKDTNEQGFE
jgi:hypothetical protein